MKTLATSTARFKTYKVDLPTKTIMRSSQTNDGWVATKRGEILEGLTGKKRILPLGG